MAVRILIKNGLGSYPIGCFSRIIPTAAVDYIRDQVREGRVNVQYVPTSLQLADFLTKNVKTEIFEDLKNLANLREI